MRIKLSITGKIGLGFGIITLAVIANSVLTQRTLNNSEKVNLRINNIYEPSTANMKRLHELITNSRMLIRSWVYIDKKTDSPDKLKLKHLHEEEFPKIDSVLTSLSEKWSPEQKEKYLNISKTIQDTLFPKHARIMGLLNSFESYDDPMVIFEVMSMVEDGGEIILLTDSALTDLSEVIVELESVAAGAREEMAVTFKKFERFITFTGILMVIASLIIGFITIRSLVKPIDYIKGLLLSMAKGILPENTLAEGKDEIGQMAYALNLLIASQRSISNFAQQIGKGNFDTEFNAISDKDILGNSLLNMRDELKYAAVEEEKRKKEDDQRNWATQGQAKFAEILRQNNDDMTELSYNIVSNLVKYINANQGGIFLINDNDQKDRFIQLMACYAYDRRKFLEKRIEFGEGLIGRCLQEKEAIYMTDIPSDYIRITSGLGKENPRSLFIVPLILNDELFGAIELASFKELEPYQREFVQKIAESIASTISIVKTNLQTTLLLEQSQQQAEEMHSQEEEMRQNMEELRATQEQSKRREEDLEKALKEAEAKIKEYEHRLSRYEG